MAINRTTIAAAAIVLAALATPHLAASEIELRYHGMYFSNAPSAITSHGHVAAGPGVFTADLVSGQSMTKFFLQVDPDIADRAHYTMHDLADSPGGALSTIGEYRAGLLQDLHNRHGGVALNSRTKAAAFQLAVWKIVYEDKIGVNETYALDIRTGNFYVRGGTATSTLDDAEFSAARLASIWLKNLSPVDVTSLHTLVDRNGVSQLTVVPLPAAALLGGLGLLAIPVLRRRQASAQT